ncbi:MAG: flagellar hook-basal body protein [Oscillospiraceae bacterium]|nr:flagellar hook-basal body protein [Oscillospiraceae bacterium]
MNISFYTSRTGMIAQQQGMNVYANNIANVNTIGYKPLRPSFAECIYTLQHPPREEWQTGHGQYISKTDLMWGQGGLVLSDQPLDFALPNDGFFMTMDRNGDTYLTRDGRFSITQIDEAGDEWVLVNGLGDFMLDYDGNRIVIPFLMSEPRNEMVRDEEGNIIEVRVIPPFRTNDIDVNTLRDMIGVYNVPNNWGLDQAPNNRFVVTERSGEPVPAFIIDENGERRFEHDKLEGMYEQSAVDLAGDMVRIIETQRSYQFNAKMVQVSDEIMKTVNNLR